MLDRRIKAIMDLHAELRASSYALCNDAATMLAYCCGYMEGQDVRIKDLEDRLRRYEDPAGYVTTIKTQRR